MDACIPNLDSSSFVHRHASLLSQKEIQEAQQGISHQIKLFCEDFTVLSLDLQFEQLLAQYSQKIYEFSIPKDKSSF